MSQYVAVLNSEAFSVYFTIGTEQMNRIVPLPFHQKTAYNFIWYIYYDGGDSGLNVEGFGSE